jgi:hypothetical protein
MMKNLFIAILLLCQVSCDSSGRVDSATNYESVRIYRYPLSLHSRYLIDEEAIKEGEHLLEKQSITYLDSLIIFNRIVNSLTPSDLNYKYFDVRVLCEIATENGNNTNLLINDVGHIKYRDKYYLKSDQLLKFLQIQD